MNFDKDLLKAAHREWLLLVLTILFGLFGGIGFILQARQLSVILNGVFLDGWSSVEITPLFGVLLAIMFGRAFFFWLGEISAGSLAVQIKTSLRGQLTEKIFSLGPSYARGENSGELVNTAMHGVESLDAYFSQYLPQVLLAFLIPVAILIVVFPVDWISGLVLLLTAPLIPIFMILIGKASEKATHRQWNTLSRLSSYFLDTLQGLQELKLLGQSKNRAAKLWTASDQYRLTTMKVLRITFLSALVLEMVGTISTAIIAVQIGLRLLYGRLVFVDAFFILLLAPEFYLPLRQLGQRFHAGANGVQAARRIFNILNAPAPTQFEPELMRHIDQVQSISFQGVSYTYPGQKSHAVEDITFTAQRGEMIAFVGATGAGKSTLAHLLLRFAPVSQGSILVNNLPLNAISMDEWRQQIAWVPQNPVLFQGSIAENIALGKPNALLDEIIRASQLAYLDDFVQTLPLKYDTPVGESGARLSGGEVQRVALARAFLVDAPILILDEPTANLDPQSESWLEASTQRLKAGRTLFVIAHRLPTVYKADQIFVLDKGRIVEQGRHRELSAAGRYYSRLLSFYGGASV